MCMEPPGCRALISTPGMTSTPSLAPAATASASPSMVSWSVSATAFRPLSLASRTRSVGVRVPSEALEWVWRSTNFIIVKPRLSLNLAGRLQMAPKAAIRCGYF